MSELNSVRSKIQDIKKDLDILNKEKEGWMTKKTSYKNEILKILGNVKELKTARNNLTSQVKMSKEERAKVDHKIPELEEQLKKLKTEKDEVSQKLGLKKDIGFIKREIEAMNQKFETEPMSFGSEKKLMQEIKQKRKELEGAGEIMKIVGRIRAIHQELDMYNKIRTVSHSKVQSIARNSQSKHENMVEESKRIDELKSKEQEAFEKFKEVKERYKARSDEFKAELLNLNVVQKKLGIDEKEHKQVTEKQQNKTLIQKIKEVEDKLTKGEKLTTEDLLILQSRPD